MDTEPRICTIFSGVLGVEGPRAMSREGGFVYVNGPAEAACGMLNPVAVDDDVDLSHSQLWP